MSIKVYIAGRYKDRERLCIIAEAMERAGGAEVTSSWLSGTHESHDDHDALDEHKASWAKEDLYDIDRCDVFLLFRGEGEMLKGGCMVELGYAIAKGKTVVLVGRKRNVFEHLPVVHRFLGEDDDLGRLWTYIKGVSKCECGV